MAFNPILSNGFAFNQPVSEPSAMTAVADLFSFGLKVAESEPEGGGRSLTEDERFTLALSDYQSAQGGAFKWDRKSVRDFMFTYPQFTPQMKGWAEGQGMILTSPVEAAQNAVIDWAQTPEGVYAVNETAGMTEAEAEAHIYKKYSMAREQEARIAETTRNASQYEAEGKLFDAQWESLRPGAKDFVDGTIYNILRPVVDQVANGVAVEITPEEMAMLGINYNKIDWNNLPALLEDIRIRTSKKFRNDYASNYGYDDLPPDAWNKEVFSSLDALVKIGESVDTPEERVKVTEALLKTDLYKKLDDAGVAVTIELLKVLPPDTAAGLISETGLATNQLLKEALTPSGGFTRESMVDAIGNASKANAESLAKDMFKVMSEATVTPAFFTAFKEASKKSGYNVVDGASFKALMKDNIPKIKELAGADVDFRNDFSDWLVSDFNQSIAVVKNNLPSGTALVVENGKFTVVPTTPEAKAMWEKQTVRAGRTGSVGYIPGLKDQIESTLKDSISVSTLNEKFSAIGLLGPMGAEVQDALGILNTESKKKTKDDSRGGVRARGRGRGRGTTAIPEEEWIPIRNGIFEGESGGDYNALFGFSNRPGGPFENIKLTEMTVDEAINFSDPSGDYGQWVKGQIGRVATPMGAFQVVGTTLRAAKEGLGLSGTEVMDQALQDEIGKWILAEQGTDAWEGYRGPRDSYASGAGGFEARGAGEASSVPVVGTTDRTVEGGNINRESVMASLESSSMLSFDSPEVQQIIEKSSSNPEEAIKIAKEVLAGKPMDPNIKALIEALVKIGGRE